MIIKFYITEIINKLTNLQTLVFFTHLGNEVQRKQNGMNSVIYSILTPKYHEKVLTIWFLKEK